MLTRPPSILDGLIRPGDTVMWGQACAEPLTLTQALVDRRLEVARIRVFLGIGAAATLAAEHADAIDFVAYCGSGTNRALAQAGVLDILPCHYSQLPGLIASGDLRIDVVMLQVSPPDEHGRYSLGLAHDYLVDAIDAARVVIGEVNESTPWTLGERSLVHSSFDLLVPATKPPPWIAPAAPGPVERAIGQCVAALIDDGATLQIGIGTIPDQVLLGLRDRRGLGLHTGAAGDAVVDLVEAGALDHSRKTVDRGVGVAGVLIGSERLARYAHRNPRLQMRGTRYTHDPSVLASLDRLVAINSALEVDLTGQINAEVAGDRYVGAVGGAADFLRGASRSRRGLPIVALPAAAGARSRIVATLSGPASTSRSDAGVVVTEYGVADLRGLTLSRRIDRMLSIAAPEHQAALEAEFARAALRAGTRRAVPLPAAFPL